VIVVVTGPIASGKTTLVQSLARELRRAGRTAATLDRDDVYELVEGSSATVGTEDRWRRANRLTAAFARAMTDDGIDVVIVESDDPIDGALHVTLTAPVESALERVQLDPTRVVSRDERFLRRHYADYRPLPADLTIDTARTPLEAELQAVLAALQS